MKISKIIEELTGLKAYIGDREVEGIMANSAVTSVNVLYLTDDGDYISTSLEGEKIASQMKATMSDHEPLEKIKVKVLNFNFCESSNDPDLVAMADVEVTNDTSSLTIKGLDLRHNDTTGEYSIVDPKFPSGVSIDGFTCRAVTSAVADRYEKIKHSDRLLEAKPERPVSFIDHTPVEMKEPTMEHSVYSRLEADKYMDWQANRIKQLEEALRLERCKTDWNDVTKTKIPLNVEIFALLEDRMDPKKLRPAVIVAKMMLAKRLTWTENKEGEVLYYDVPAGNFHCCNGAQIKYWKAVSIPSEQ